MAARPLYRSRQFLRALRAQVSPEDLARVDAVLPPAQAALFRSMPVALQRHHLDVHAHLVAAGCTDPDVLAAALLHDVGKGQVTVWARVVHVLLEPLAGLYARLAADGPGFRGQLYRLRHHPELGAAQARAAGASPGTCWLIEHQEDPVLPADAMRRAQLLQLQAVDNQH